jgi:Domain of unknown function (DUF4263)
VRFEFRLQSRLAGISVNHALAGQTSLVRVRELLGPHDPDLVPHLEQVQAALFSRLPGLPPPPFIDHVLVLIRHDLSAVAYANELNVMETMVATRPIAKGSMVSASDVSAVTAVNLGVDVPTDAAIVLVRSFSWRRSLYFDLSPLQIHMTVPPGPPLQQALVQQSMVLHGLGRPTVTRRQKMEEGLALLKRLLETRCDGERQYQELLEEHPWMLVHYRAVQRHASFDDKRIPDFVATRVTDDNLDIIELKQPFLGLFRQDGEFAAPFNDAWNQAEGYVTFAEQQRAYLREEKGLRFENPSCMLLLGIGLTDPQLRKLRERKHVAGVSGS